MDHQEIKHFVEKVMPELDEPGVYVPVVNQYLVKDEDWGENKTRICYVLPVPESAAIQNLGIAILTKIGNEEMGPDYCASVCYFPEVKMWKRMIKNDIPLFDNWLKHDLKDFDVIGISSFYALQYMNFIPMLNQTKIPYKAEDRLGSWDYPLVVLGGIQCYSAEPVAPVFDCFMIGEGEEMNVKFLNLLRKRKAEGVSKREFLLEAAREIQGIYLPWAYEFEYFEPDADDHKNQIKGYHLTEEAKEHGVPLKVLKSAIEFRDRPPCDKTFVSNGVGGSMSIGSDYCANSCSNLCSFCQGSYISLPYREVPFDVAKQSARNIIKNTGTKDIGPYCVLPGTRIQTSKGILPIERIESILKRGGKIEVFTRDGRKPVSQFHAKEVDSYVKIRTSFGQVISTTKDHQFLLDSGEWKRAEDLCEEDVLLTKVGYDFPDKYVEVNGVKIDEDWGWFLGHVCGDGHIIDQGRRLEISTAFDEVERESFNKEVLDRILPSVIDPETRKHNTSGHMWTRKPVEGFEDGCARLIVHSVQLLDFVEACGLSKYCTAHTKVVPDVIFRSPKGVVIQYLKALFDGDGTVYVTSDETLEKKGSKSVQRTIELKTASYEMAKGVQQLLFQLGLISQIKVEYKEEGKVACHVALCGDSKQKFTEIVGFFSEKKQEKAKLIEGRNYKLKFTEEGLLKTKIMEIIEVDEPTEVFDLGVEGTHEYTAESIVVHNCFNVSDLSYVNRFTRDLLLEDHIKVALSSERLDTMDDDFVRATIKSGSRSFTVAIEAASPRGRHILNKNLDEEHILRAFEIMFRNGATKIKVYNIASWPFEQEEDRTYYAILMEKIEALRKKYNAKTQIRLSFTPFQAKPFTCLQWAKMENVEIDENGDPVFLKTYNGMMEGVKAVCDYRFRFGTASAISLVAQALAFGDRRLFPIVEAMATDDRIKYYGGMGMGPDGVPVFTELMRKFTTLNWDYFAREKDEDEIFPWEAISTGVDKSWLLTYYKKAKEASQTPVTEEGWLRQPCYVRCTVCGVCRSIERGTYEKPKFDAFWPTEIYGKDRWLPQFAYGDNSEDHLNMESVLAEYVKPQKLRVYRLEVDINPRYRYVDSQKLKYRIRRACNRAGIPITTDVAAASDKILEKAWFSGKEIYELYSADKRFEISEEEFVQKVNAEFSDDCMVVNRCGKYSEHATKLRDNFEYVLYSVTFNNLDFDYSAALQEKERFDKASEYLVKMKQKSKTKRDAFETVEVNSKESIYKVFVRNNDDDTWTLFAAIRDNLSIYEFLAVFLHTAKRNLYKYPAVIEEYMLKNNDGATLDMFAEVCTECGEEIETNIWGEPVDDMYCLEHKYMIGFKHRDIQVESGYSEDFLEEADEDADARFGIGEVTMDDDDEDTDLEDEILKKTGNTGV